MIKRKLLTSFWAKYRVIIDEPRKAPPLGGNHVHSLSASQGEFPPSRFFFFFF